MNKFLLFAIVLFFISIVLLLPKLSITSIDDLALDKNSEIIAGEGETCKTPYSEIKCGKGLECILISTNPHITGVCLKPGTKLEEDLINRPNDFVDNDE